MIASKKQALRSVMKDKRSVLFDRYPEAGSAIAKLFFEKFTLSPSMVVGGYWPTGSELNLCPLLETLVKKGFMCALPCTSSQTLVFRLWDLTAPLVKNKFNFLEPSPVSPRVIPSLLLIPLLAFDKKGRRLGYGQGYYDRYLQHHACLKIGIGFQDQEIDHVPTQAHDQHLDYVLTDRALIACG